MPGRDQLAEFTAWCRARVTGAGKGQARIFLDRLSRAFCPPGCLDVGGTAGYRLRRDREDGGGTALAGLVWNPVLVVPLPPLAGQTRMVAEVERRLSLVEELESVVSANLQMAVRLR